MMYVRDNTGNMVPLVDAPVQALPQVPARPRVERPPAAPPANEGEDMQEEHPDPPVN